MDSFNNKRVKSKNNIGDYMNEIQYIQARIKDLEKIVNDPNISDESKKNSAHALVVSRLDLKRALDKQDGES